MERAKHKRIIPGGEYMDRIRSRLTSLEMLFSGSDPADPVEVSELLVSIETNRDYMEKAICNELSSTRLAIDISQL